MARPPVVKSIPLALMANGRTTAGLIRDSNTLLRRNVEMLKQFEPQNPEEKAAIEEYMNDPSVNPMAEKKSEEQPETRPLTDKEKKIAKLLRHFQDCEEEELDMHLRFLHATKKASNSKAGPRGVEQSESNTALAMAGSGPGMGKAVAHKS
jgi:hypothetical protein